MVKTQPGPLIGTVTIKIHFPAAGMLLGLHYEEIIESYGHCPIPVLCGEHRLGKTKSAKSALRLVGNDANFFASVKDRFIPRLCARSSFPPVLDDLKRTSQLEEIAISFYNGGKDGSCFKESRPKTCPMVTVNWEALEGVTNDYRQGF